MVPDMAPPLIYGQNGKVSPDVHHWSSLGTVTSCRTVDTPGVHRSKLLVGAHLLINLQLDLAAGRLSAPTPG